MYLEMLLYFVSRLLFQRRIVVQKRTHTLEGQFQCLLVFLLFYWKLLTAFLAISVDSRITGVWCC